LNEPPDPRTPSAPPDPAGPSALVLAGEQAGITLAAAVRELLPGTSWSQARDLCAEGKAWVNGKPEADSARRLAAGDRVEVRRKGPAGPRPPQGNKPGDLIVHLDADVAVVRKPAGLLTVPFTRDDKETLLSRARVAARRMEAARGGDSSPTLRAVQRLDKETSGLVVFARNVTAQRHLQEQLGAHTVLRRYVAIAHGEVQDAIHDTWLLQDRGDGLRGSWGRFRPAWGEMPRDAKQAVTFIKVQERLREATLVTCELETGRQHQIRIHLAEAGHPLLGEPVYNRDYPGPWIPAPRPMLHAAVLGFVHPRTGRPVRFEDPPPADFNAVLARLRRPERTERR
jgi:23S rRNA pseudouridine1911/1915/1917 synthase